MAGVGGAGLALQERPELLERPGTGPPSPVASWASCRFALTLAAVIFSPLSVSVSKTLICWSPGSLTSSRAAETGVSPLATLSWIAVGSMTRLSRLQHHVSDRLSRPATCFIVRP